MIVKSARGNFLCAVATLVGMIIGAGIFGIPYAVAQAGFFTGVFYLLLIGAAVVLVHLFYGEVVLRTNQPHRLVGYAGKYLGRRAKKIATLTVLFEYYGSLLAYLILGGDFLMIIFGSWLGGSKNLWAVIFFIVGAGLILYGVRSLAKNELFLVGLLLLTLSILLVIGSPWVDLDNLKGFNLKNSFLPYGVILFSLAGSVAIPEVRNIMKGQERKMKKAIIWGTVIPIIFYLFFALVIVGVTGLCTSEDAIGSLASLLGNKVVMLGAVFGILAILTSFLVLGHGLEEIFHDDFRLNKKVSLALALLVPLAAYLLGLRSFVLIIGIVGALVSGLDGILTILIYFKAKKMGDRHPEYQIKSGSFWGWILIFVFSLGIIYQLVYLTGK
jgi:tyrosine-specific transport protein